MARNAKALQKALFTRLRKHIAGHSAEHHAANPDAPRWVKGEPEDQQALIEAKVVHSIELLGYGPLSLIAWKNRVFGSFPVSILKAGAIPPVAWFIHAPVNRGLGTLVLIDETCRINASPEEAVESAFGATGELPWEDISGLFEAGHPFEFREALQGRNQPELWSILQAACAQVFVSTHHPRWLGPFEADFVALCDGDAARFSGSALLGAARAVDRQQAFLHMYRSFEALFRVMLIESFLSKIGHSASGPRHVIESAVEDELLWRLRGDLAISRLISRIDVAARARIAALLGVQDHPDKVGRALYEIRNRIAHGSIFYRPPPISDDTLKGCLDVLSAAFGAVAIPDAWIPDRLED